MGLLGSVDSCGGGGVVFAYGFGLFGVCLDFLGGFVCCMSNGDVMLGHLSPPRAMEVVTMLYSSLLPVLSLSEIDIIVFLVLLEKGITRCLRGALWIIKMLTRMRVYYLEEKVMVVWLNISAIDALLVRIL